MTKAAQAQGKPKHAGCSETKVGAKPKKVRVRPWFQLDPAKPQGKKRQSKSNGGHSGQGERPSAHNMTLAQQGSRDDQFENADAQSHEDNQERNRKKANSITDKGVLDESERAKRKTIQHQQPAFAICGPQNTGCDRAGCRRQRELTQKRNRAAPGMESQGSVRILHD